MAAEKFRNSGVGVVLSVTPCWCYGFETIDMDGEMPKAIWGFNGTERPGAVYLASALASHTQKGLPTFGIYGRDVQEVTNMEIPEDVKEKLLRFARAGIAVATMRGKSYLSIGSVSMGIAGSIPNPDFFQEYLGMRNEYVDASWVFMIMKSLLVPWCGWKNIVRAMKGWILIQNIWCILVKRKMHVGNMW
jgi:L-fucose isomerase